MLGLRNVGFTSNQYCNSARVQAPQKAKNIAFKGKDEENSAYSIELNAKYILDNRDHNTRLLAGKNELIQPDLHQTNVDLKSILFSFANALDTTKDPKALAEALRERATSI